MGTIKDVLDLVNNLIDRVKDKKMREMLLPIKEKVIDLKAEAAEQKEIHAREMEQLREMHNKQVEALEDRVRNLFNENKNLHETIKRESDTRTVLTKYRFDERTHLYKNDQGQDFCPHCLHDNIPAEVPLGKPGSHWRCNKCGSTYPNPDFVFPDIPRVVPLSQAFGDDIIM